MAVLDLLDCVSVVVARQWSVTVLRMRYCWTYDVTGTSPQSSTVAQLLKGLASRATL